MAWGEIQNNNVFQINEKPSIMADSVGIKDPNKIWEYLRSEYKGEISEEEIKWYIENVQKIADTINQKVKDRKLSTNNLYVTDDGLVKQYVEFAEAEVKKDMAKLWTDANLVLVSLINKIQVWNWWHIERNYVQN